MDIAGVFVQRGIVENALKTLAPAEREHVLAGITPGESKSRGRRVTLRPDWNAGARVWAMQRMLVAKFTPGSTLLEELVATGDLTLIETNRWHDQFWGSCDCPKHDAVPGTNMLGRLIMAVRAHHAPPAG